MALSSTMYRIQVELSDIDRGVYESLDLRTACHPSEETTRLVLRVLARAIAHEEGLEFGRGLSTPEDAAIISRDMTGEIKTWIDVGAPNAERLHRASKRAARVLVFTDKPPPTLRREWSSRPIHKSEGIEVTLLSSAFVQDLAAHLARNQTWYLVLQDGTLTVSVEEANHSSTLKRMTLPEFIQHSDQ